MPQHLSFIFIKKNEEKCMQSFSNPQNIEELHSLYNEVNRSLNSLFVPYRKIPAKQDVEIILSKIDAYFSWLIENTREFTINLTFLLSTKSLLSDFIERFENYTPIFISDSIEKISTSMSIFHCEYISKNNGKKDDPELKENIPDQDTNLCNIQSQFKFFHAPDSPTILFLQAIKDGNYVELEKLVQKNSELMLDNNKSRHLSPVEYAFKMLDLYAIEILFEKNIIANYPLFYSQIDQQTEFVNLENLSWRCEQLCELLEYYSNEENIIRLRDIDLNQPSVAINELNEALLNHGNAIRRLPEWMMNQYSAYPKEKFISLKVNKNSGFDFTIIGECKIDTNNLLSSLRKSDDPKWLGDSICLQIKSDLTILRKILEERMKEMIKFKSYVAQKLDASPTLCVKL